MRLYLFQIIVQNLTVNTGLPALGPKVVASINAFCQPTEKRERQTGACTPLEKGKSNSGSYFFCSHPTDKILVTRPPPGFRPKRLESAVYMGSLDSYKWALPQDTTFGPSPGADPDFTGPEMHTTLGAVFSTQNAN